MPANPLPRVTVDPNGDARRNFQNLLVWAQSVSPRLYATGKPVLGRLPVPSTPQGAYIMESGWTTLKFVSHEALFYFPQPFPNGVLSVQITVDGIDTQIINTVSQAATLSYIPLLGSTANGNMSFSFTVIGF